MQQSIFRGHNPLFIGHRCRYVQRIITNRDIEFKMLSKAIKLIIFFLLIIAVILALFYFREKIALHRITSFIEQFGWWGPVIFIGLYVLATLLFLPGSVMTIAGGLLFGAVYGTLYNIIGAVIGASIAFLIARYLASNWVAQRAKGRTKQILDGVAKSGWRFVAVVRLVPLIPFNLLNYVLGLTRIPIFQYIIASAVFMLPGTFAYTYLGSLGKAALTQDFAVVINRLLITVGLLVLLALMPWVIKQWKQVRDEKS